jgi:FkbM family methyltransferase|tara:strand:+ start:409 stop:1023 length:615 start_codon:yes stop_codon:yes gene_type:complete
MNILQIGCNEANDKVSEFLEFYKKESPKALLVDASSSALDLAREFYKDFNNIKFQHVAVVDTDEKEVDLFYPVDIPNNVHCSLLEQHVKTHKKIEGQISNKPPMEVKKEKVPALRISALLDYFDGEPIDRLYVDVEGLDCQIINDIDLDKYKIGYIRFEHTHSEGTFESNGPTLQKTIQRLSRFDYSILGDQKCPEDLVAIKML